jgi:hypothetical protein
LNDARPFPAEDFVQFVDDNLSVFHLWTTPMLGRAVGLVVTMIRERVDSTVGRFVATAAGAAKRWHGARLANCRDLGLF